MNAKTKTHQHILFGMLIITLGMSKSWLLTAAEVNGSAEFASARPIPRSKNPSDIERRRDEPKKSDQLADDSKLTRSAEDSRRVRPIDIDSKPGDNFKRHSRSQKENLDDSTSDDSAQIDDLLGSDSPARSKNKEEIRIGDASKVSVKLEGQMSSNGSLPSQSVKLTDKDGVEYDGKIDITVSEKEEFIYKVEGNQVKRQSSGKKPVVIATISTEAAANCDGCAESVEIPITQNGNVDSTFFKTAASLLEKRLKEKAKTDIAELETARKKKLEAEREEKLADAREQKRRELMESCEIYESGGKLVNARKEKNKYSDDHLTCLRTNVFTNNRDDEDKGETDRDRDSEQQEKFAEIAEHFWDKLATADSPKELTAARRELRKIERKFKRVKAIEPDLKVLNRAVSAMDELARIKMSINDPEVRKIFMESTLKKFQSSIVAANGKGLSPRMRDVVTSWNNELASYIQESVTPTNIGLPGTQLASTSSVFSATANPVNWDSNTRISRVSVGANGQLPQFLPVQRYNENNPMGLGGLNGQSLQNRFGNIDNSLTQNSRFGNGGIPSGRAGLSGWRSSAGAGASPSGIPGRI